LFDLHRCKQTYDGDQLGVEMVAALGPTSDLAVGTAVNGAYRPCRWCFDSASHSPRAARTSSRGLTSGTPTSHQVPPPRPPGDPEPNLGGFTGAGGGLVGGPAPLDLGQRGPVINGASGHHNLIGPPLPVPITNATNGHRVVVPTCGHGFHDARDRQNRCFTCRKTPPSTDPPSVQSEPGSGGTALPGGPGPLRKNRRLSLKVKEWYGRDDDPSLTRGVPGPSCGVGGRRHRHRSLASRPDRHPGDGRSAEPFVHPPPRGCPSVAVHQRSVERPDRGQMATSPPRSPGPPIGRCGRPRFRASSGAPRPGG